MTNSVNDNSVSSPYRVWTRPKNWKPLPSPKDVPTTPRKQAKVIRKKKSRRTT